MNGIWRVDHTAPGSNVPITTYHDTEDQALMEAHNLRFGGCRNVAAWFMQVVA